MTQPEHYSYRVQWSPQDDEYVGLVSEFPSLSWLDATHIGAFNGIVALVNEVITDMHTNGEDVPQPFSERHFSGNFQVRTSPQVHRALSQEAAEQGISLNKLVGERLASV